MICIRCGQIKGVRHQKFHGHRFKKEARIKKVQTPYQFVKGKRQGTDESILSFRQSVSMAFLEEMTKAKRDGASIDFMKGLESMVYAIEKYLFMEKEISKELVEK